MHVNLDKYSTGYALAAIYRALQVSGPLERVNGQLLSRDNWVRLTRTETNS